MSSLLSTYVSTVRHKIATRVTLIQPSPDMLFLRSPRGQKQPNLRLVRNDLADFVAASIGRQAVNLIIKHIVAMLLGWCSTEGGSLVDVILTI